MHLLDHQFFFQRSVHSSGLPFNNSRPFNTRQCSSSVEQSNDLGPTNNRCSSCVLIRPGPLTELTFQVNRSRFFSLLQRLNTWLQRAHLRCFCAALKRSDRRSIKRSIACNHSKDWRHSPNSFLDTKSFVQTHIHCVQPWTTMALWATSRA